MNERSQMQGGKYWIFPKDINTDRLAVAAVVSTAPMWEKMHMLRSFWGN
jgi:hypothetical protein